MHLSRPALALLQAALLLTLSACGGGGGDAGGNNNNDGNKNNNDGSWLTFNPSPVQASVFEGETVELAVVATDARTTSAPFNIAITDAKGVITPQVTISQLNSTQYRAALRTAATLAAGTNSTTLVLRACEDSPTICARPLPGSPWNIPVTVNVKPKAEAAARLTLSPATAQIVTYPDETMSLTIEGKWAPELAGKVNIAIERPQGLINPALNGITYSNDGFRTDIVTQKIAAPATMNGNIVVRGCFDAVDVCKLPVGGSPWIVPLTLKVNPTTNLSALRPLPQLGPWSTERGNAAHTGYVAASFDASKFSRRWSLAGDNYSNTSTSLALDGDRVYAVRRAWFESMELAAVDEASGAYAWRTVLNAASAGAPAAADGRVFVKAYEANGGGKLLALDQASGAITVTRPDYARGHRFLAPVIHGADVYLADGYSGSVKIVKASAPSFAPSWSVITPDAPMFSPSVDANGVYIVANGTLFAGRTDTGEQLLAIPGVTALQSGNVGPVLSDQRSAFVADNSMLTAYNLATGKVAWTAKGGFKGQPAYAKGVVYALDGAHGQILSAYAADTGALLWSTGQLYLSGMATPSFVHTHQVIVTDNLAFVSGDYGTMAVDLATRKIVWAHPRIGDLSISRNGILYILGYDGRIDAINLQ